MINQILIAGIAVLLGLLGAYLTSWEKDIYQNYFKYILPMIGVIALLFLFIESFVSRFFFFVFTIGIVWAYSTKFFFRKNEN